MSLTRREVKQLREALVLKSPICAYCGRGVKSEGPRRASIDHRVPLSKGGTNDPSNLLLACNLCNQTKGSRTIEQWAEDVLKPIEASRPKVSYLAVAPLALSMNREWF